MRLEEFVAELDARYDADVRMPWSPATGPGYHTRVPEGARVHQTKQAADYAIALLRLGRSDRAGEVLNALAGLQVTDPLSAHYGIWGWFLEEPPDQMSPADWNWADFIGVRLAQVLAVHGQLLDLRVRQRVRAALHHAAMSVFRRNVDPGYTNIAVMGAVTAAAAGQLLRPGPQPAPGPAPRDTHDVDEVLEFVDGGLLLDFGRRRLRAVLALHDEAGGFTEYNSPAYGRVVLEELERAALIVTDPDFRAVAERLRELTWAALAERFHPGTGQLAGPMSRAYHDWIQPDLAEYLRAQTGATIVAVREDRPAEPRVPLQERPPQAPPLLVPPRLVPPLLVPPLLVPPLPCPRPIAERFRALPSVPYQVRTRFSSDTAGTSWFAEDACLGSADEEFAWVQRRPLLGYWRTPDDPAVVLRARMVLNGHDLSAAWCRQHQEGPRVLSAWWLSYDSGDFHPVLDRPAGSVFDVGDLRLSVALRGRGVEAGELGDGVFALRAGERQAVVHTSPARFLGRSRTWQAVNDGDEARIEVRLYQGPSMPLDFHQARLRAAFALELLAAGEQPGTAAVTGEPDGNGLLRWRWDGLRVCAPAEPTPFDR
ncbi:hypothetical protein [Nonomuraea africana]|uniref:Uncharacterized protein n=1 Tax=Nonomuraea africana TaxID=46171 RepID=A0ABR9KBG5_9ACTN|nr:hypothetical protein [Nonomuraea africana]MBE1559354.1 hypothetical protein [Nonomuraea africana]